VKAGKLRRRMRLQARTNGTDAAGQPVRAWADVPAPAADVWTDPRGATGMGSIRGDAEGVGSAINRYSFRTRYRRDVTTEHRLVDAVDGTPFDIKDVRHDLAGREWTDIVCEIGGNDG